MFGPSHPAERDRIEAALKRDKLVKAGELKRTRKEAEAARKIMGLKGGGTTHGLATEVETASELSWADILNNSEVVELRKGADAIKTFAMDEAYLSKMPYFEQPMQLASTLLPYQLQVSFPQFPLLHPRANYCQGPGMVDSKRAPSHAIEKCGQSYTIVETRHQRSISECGFGFRLPVTTRTI